MSFGKKFLICPILPPMSDLTPFYGTLSGIYGCAITAPQGKFETQFSFGKANITYIYIQTACQEFNYKNNRIT